VDRIPGAVTFIEEKDELVLCAALGDFTCAQKKTQRKRL